MKKSVLLGPVLGVFFLAGCGSGGSTSTTSTSTGNDYPQLYLDEKLPQYADANLAQVISDGPTLKEGVLLRLESQQAVETIAAYYDEQMEKLGWTMPVKNKASNTLYVAQYDNGSKYVQLTVSQITGESQTITLSLKEQ